jgi:hypothetical protein
MTTERIRPFDCGMQDTEWVDYNCLDCEKCGESPGTCKIDEELIIAACGDGTISAEIADRMGYTANKGKRVWRCPERV